MSDPEHDRVVLFSFRVPIEDNNSAEDALALLASGMARGGLWSFASLSIDDDDEGARLGRRMIEVARLDLDNAK